MKKLLIVTNSLTGGGAERSMNLLANELSNRGWKVGLVPINLSGPDLVEPTCEVYSIGRQWKGNIFETLIAIWKFDRIVNSWKPEILVLNCELPELFGALLRFPCKIVVVQHIDRPWITRRLLGRVVRNVLRFKKTTWVSVSSHFSIWPEKSGPSAVLLNAIQFSRSPSISHITEGVPNSLSKLIFIGRLTEQKRPNWVLDIGCSLSIPSIFIGEGNMLTDLMVRASEENIDATFMGYLTDPWAEISGGCLLIVPSEYEGDGLVILEALQRNVPLVLADIPEFRRFGLPDLNYCQDVNTFISTVDIQRNDISNFVVNPESIKATILSRTPNSVGDSWDLFLNKL